jgi:hypothetical protein
MEAHRVVRRRGSHIFQTIGSQMTVKLSTLRAGRPPLPRKRFLVLISVRGWVDPRVRVRLEGLCQLEKTMTSSGTEPATFRLIAQYLNQLRYRAPHYIYSLTDSRISQHSMEPEEGEVTRKWISVLSRMRQSYAERVSVSTRSWAVVAERNCDSGVK